jgi:hypothetical protein
VVAIAAIPLLVITAAGASSKAAISAAAAATVGFPNRVYQTSPRPSFLTMSP